MSQDNRALDAERRLWLTATIVTGGARLIATTIPFVSSMAPSERARATGAPVEVDLGSIQPGELKTVEWRGKPGFVLRRSTAMLNSLTQHDDLLADPGSRRSEQPEYTVNVDRSVKPEIAVMVGICTHLGCIPTFRPTPGSPDIGPSWPGGFYCPCHGSKFDLAGRVFKNCRRRPTWSCLPTTSRPTAACSSAWIPRAEPGGRTHTKRTEP